MSAAGRSVRIVLVAAGAGTTAFGLFTLVTTMPPVRALWVAVWLAATVVIHDGLLVPVVSFARARLRSAGRNLPASAIAAVEVGFMAFATVALFVVPEIWAQLRGTANPTVLPGAYAARLIALGVIIAVIVAIAGTVSVTRARRRR